jgi:hypothetical protein
VDENGSRAAPQIEKGLISNLEENPQMTQIAQMRRDER